MRPKPTDCAPLWQAWVAAGKGREERLARFDYVPQELRARVASHLRTVQAIEAFHVKHRQHTSLSVAKANRRVDRGNPYGQG